MDYMRRFTMPSVQRIVLQYLLAAVVFVAHMCRGADFLISAESRVQTSEITCWTCSDKSNNEACNDWAPDLRCPFNHTVCQTRHRFDPFSGLSHLVNKQCVPPEECTPSHIGCTAATADPRGEQECVSCCDYSYCNQEVPYNRSSALRLSRLTTVSTGTAAGTVTSSVKTPLSLGTLVLTLHALLRVSSQQNFFIGAS